MCGYGIAKYTFGGDCCWLLAQACTILLLLRGSALRDFGCEKVPGTRVFGLRKRVAMLRFVFHLVSVIALYCCL